VATVNSRSACEGLLKFNPRRREIKNRLLEAGLGGENSEKVGNTNGRKKKPGKYEAKR